MREIVGIILLLILGWLHFKNANLGSLKSFYWPAFGLKILAGICLGIVYKYYYLGGDTWSFFNQAELFSEGAFQNWKGFSDLVFYSKYELIEGFAYVNQPRAALMVKLVAIINLLTNNNYWITSAYFSLFSFMGVWAFVVWVQKSFIYGKMAAVILFIWPSFVFWSSGILKESVAVGLIFFIVTYFFESINSKSIRNVSFLVFGVYMLFLIKYYFAVVLFVVLVVYSIVSLTSLNKKSYVQQTLAWVLLLVGGLFFAGFLHPNLEPHRILEVVINNNQAFIELSNTSSVIHYANFSSEWVWLIANSPKAIFAGIFMPLVINSESLLYSVSSVENWIMIIFLIRAIVLVRKSDFNKNYNLFVAPVFYILLLSVFLALSTPNLGTLSRYQVAYVPFLLVLIMLGNKFYYPFKKLKKGNGKN